MKERINILYLDNTFTFGGAINSLGHLLKALKQDRYNPVLVTAQPEAFLKERFSGITYYALQLKLSWVHGRFYRKLITLPFFRRSPVIEVIHISRLLYWLVCVILPEAFTYYRIGKRHKADVVHLNNSLRSQLAGALAGRMLRVPCISHQRDFDQIDILTKIHTRLVDYHIAISTSIKEHIMAFGVPESKICIVPDAIDLDEFHDDTDIDYLLREFQHNGKTKSFGIFGRIVEWKGIREFVIAADQVLKRIPGAKAFIVGGPSDGSPKYENDVRELVYSLGRGDDIIFTGYRRDVPALMKMMDVVVHASTRPEPFGMVLVEAMAMGKPVVATRGGGPMDIVIDGQTGFLVDFNDPDAMADKIVEILRNSELAGMIGMNAKNRVVQMYCKERYARQLEDVYESLLNRRTSD